MQVLGYEGAWGSVFMAVLGLPLAWLMPGNDIGKAYYSTTLHRVALLDIGMPCSSQAKFTQLSTENRCVPGYCGALLTGVYRSTCADFDWYFASFVPYVALHKSSTRNAAGPFPCTQGGTRRTRWTASCCCGTTRP